MFSFRNKKVKLNSKFSFPLTRDDLGFNFDEKKYMHNLKQCEKNLLNLNIPFNELYSQKAQTKDEVHQNVQIIINPMLFSTIKNHIRTIDKFVYEELNEQKIKLNYKTMNKLITCENEIKEDIIDKLYQHKDFLYFMHQLISDMEEKLKMYQQVRDRNSQMTIENDLMVDELKRQKEFQEKIVNNIKYYKDNIRHYAMLIDAIKSKRVISSYKDKPKAETERSKTFIDIDQTANRTLSSFRKTYNSFFNRTTFFQKENAWNTLIKM